MVSRQNKAVHSSAVRSPSIPSNRAVGCTVAQPVFTEVGALPGSHVLVTTLLLLLKYY
jgi:hypothetical protein